MSHTIRLAVAFIVAFGTLSASAEWITANVGKVLISDITDGGVATGIVSYSPTRTFGFINLSGTYVNAPFSPPLSFSSLNANDAGMVVGTLTSSQGVVFNPQAPQTPVYLPLGSVAYVSEAGIPFGSVKVSASISHAAIFDPVTGSSTELSRPEYGTGSTYVSAMDNDGRALIQTSTASFLYDTKTGRSTALSLKALTMNDNGLILGETANGKVAIVDPTGGTNNRLFNVSSYCATMSNSGLVCTPYGQLLDTNTGAIRLVTAGMPAYQRLGIPANADSDNDYRIFDNGTISHLNGNSRCRIFREIPSAPPPLGITITGTSTIQASVNSHTYTSTGDLVSANGGTPTLQLTEWDTPGWDGGNTYGSSRCTITGFSHDGLSQDILFTPKLSTGFHMWDPGGEYPHQSATMALHVTGNGELTIGTSSSFPAGSPANLIMNIGAEGASFSYDVKVFRGQTLLGELTPTDHQEIFPVLAGETLRFEMYQDISSTTVNTANPTYDTQTLGVTFTTSVPEPATLSLLVLSGLALLARKRRGH